MNNIVVKILRKVHALFGWKEIRGTLNPGSSSNTQFRANKEWGGGDFNHKNSALIFRIE